MVTITYVEHNGLKHVVHADPGKTVMQAAKANNVPGILADCGGMCACATCHVFVDDAWLGKLPPMAETEDAMLEFGKTDRARNSRLTCQIAVTDALEGLVVRVPKTQV
jgi:2Fe-2S ferredoxin